MKIVIIGGSGLIGSRVVERLRRLGHEAVPAAPNTGVNTITGAGLADVLHGAGVVVDVSNSPSFEDTAVMEFFRTSTRNILAAEAAAGVQHHVALSVVGSGRLPYSGYMRAKVAQEQLIESSSIPYSIVHATQFFEFIVRIADAATEGNTVRIPPVLFRPIAADDVASAVTGVALGAPLDGIVEVAGPEQFRFDELVRRVLAARSDPRVVVADPQARYYGALLAKRSLVPGDDARLGKTTIGEWLDRNATARAAAAPQAMSASATSADADVASRSRILQARLP
ncbi:MAG TPA: SDR family oxidoreductase [Gemmatimonadaceae bacterium]